MTTNGQRLTAYLELSDSAFAVAVRDAVHKHRATGDPDTAAILAALHLKLEECQALVEQIRDDA